MEKIQFLFKPASTRGFEELMEKYEVLMPAEGFKLTDDTLSTLPKDITILVCEFTIPITSEVIDYFPHLKLIANYAVGFNNIDVAYANAKGIKVANTPQAVVQSTAELTMGLLLSVSRRVSEWDRLMRRQRSSEKGGLHGGMGTDLKGRRAGIIGYGNIGKAVGRMMQAFGIDVVYNKRRPLSAEEEQELGVTYATQEEIFRNCDIISLHTPYTKESHHLVNTETLAMMKPNAILLNAARGKVIDEAALVQALKSKSIYGAGLDVFEHDDNPLDELYDLPNVTMTPHVGTQTTEARIDMARELSDNVLGFLLGDRPVAYVHI